MYVVFLVHKIYKKVIILVLLNTPPHENNLLNGRISLRPYHNGQSDFPSLKYVG